MGIDHRVAPHSQGKRPGVLGSIYRTCVERHMSLDRLVGQCRHACRDLAVNWNVGNSDLLNRCDDRARLTCLTVDKAFPLERAKVLHYRGLAGEAKVILNLARARCDTL